MAAPRRLPRVGESLDAEGRTAYGMDPAPGSPLKRVSGKSSAEEALSSWYEFLCRKEAEDLGLIRNRNGLEIPWRLRNETDYDMRAEDVRRSFVAERLKQGAAVLTKCFCWLIRRKRALR